LRFSKYYKNQHLKKLFLKQLNESICFKVHGSLNPKSPQTSLAGTQSFEKFLCKYDFSLAQFGDLSRRHGKYEKN
jgi:hypothetical protein